MAAHKGRGDTLPLAVLQHYARIGAEVELQRIYTAWPDLRPTPPAQPQRATRRTRKLTKAQRFAISERMKRYWSKQRAKQAA